MHTPFPLFTRPREAILCPPASSLPPVEVFSRSLTIVFSGRFLWSTIRRSLRGWTPEMPLPSAKTRDLCTSRTAWAGSPSRYRKAGMQDIPHPGKGLIIKGREGRQSSQVQSFCSLYMQGLSIFRSVSEQLSMPLPPKQNLFSEPGFQMFLRPTLPGH